MGCTTLRWRHEHEFASHRFVFPTRIADASKRMALTAFLRWMLGPGQRQAAALGYLALPKEVVTKEEEAIAIIR